MKTVLFTLIWLTALHSATAQSPTRDLATRADRIDAMVRSEMARDKIPGLALAVVEAGRVVLERGYGMATLEWDAPVASDTLFQSGSLGKQFTAAAVMSLVEQGKIGLDDPLTRYFPQAPGTWQDITVRQLLTHTSGLPGYDGAQDSATGINYQRNYTEEELMRFAFGLPLEFEPGTRWRYSDTGYVLLGFIIRKSSGQHYGDLLRERIFMPLGMETARVISEADIIRHRAAGYRLVDGELKNQEWVAPSLNTTADGSLYLSLRDLIAWDRGVREGKILSAKSWQPMFSPAVLKSGNTFPYGFGWALESFNGQLRIQHDGEWQGFRSYYARDVQPSLSVIVLANAAQADVRRIGAAVAGLWQPSLTPRVDRPLADDPKVRARLERCLTQVRSGSLSPQDLAYVQRGFFPGLAAEYQALLARPGMPRQVTLMAQNLKGDDWLYRYELSFVQGSLSVTLGLAPDGKVAGFSLVQAGP